MSVASIRVLGENLWADYGSKSYESRLDDLNETRDEARASLVLGCESGNYADGKRLSLAYGWRGKRAGTVPNDEASYVLHSGNDVRISGSIHWDPLKHRVLDEGWFHTLRTSTHDGLTWAVLQHRQSGVISVAGVMHCVPWPIGPNDVKKWNDQRFSEVSIGLGLMNGLRTAWAKSRKLEVVPGLLGEDFNGSRADAKYPGGDGPGRAAKDHGWVDAWTTAVKRTGTSSPQIDRLFVTREGVTVREHITLPTRGGTDHKYAIAAALDLTNRRAS